MRVLGLDPSLRSYGWAIYDSLAQPRDRKVASGHEGTLSSTVPVVRFIHFRALVKSLLQRFPVDTVGIESPAYGGGAFSERHFGLMMFSLEAIFEARKNCVLFDPTTLKFLVAKGSAVKTDMQRFVQLDTMNTRVINNDEADAYCIGREAARFCLTRLEKLKPEELSPNEQSVFLTRNRKKKLLDGTVSKKQTAHIFRENSRFFEFSKVPQGSVALPDKSAISQELLDWLEPEHEDLCLKP